VKRRTFLLAGLGAGGALMLGWSLMPPRQRMRGSAPLSDAGGRVALNGWLTVAPDDTVTVIVPKAEMGQGVHTALAMMLAEELECDWARVRTEQSPVDAIYANLTVGRDALPFSPDNNGLLVRTVKWYSDKLLREAGLMMTGGSSSIRDLWDPVRDAGALARATLVDAAARTWSVDAQSCVVENGVIRSGANTMSYGALIASDALLTPATRWTRKDPGMYRVIGSARVRLDAAAKSDGSAVFGMDVRPEGVVYAAVTMSPVLGGSVRSFDASAAKQSPGVLAVVPLSGVSGSAQGVAAIANRWPRARKALAALAVQWEDGPHRTLSSDDVMNTLRSRAAETGGRTFRRVGDVDDALAAAATRVTATYSVPYLAHTTMEPPNCTVRVSGDRADVWVGTQVPTQARAAVATLLGLRDEAVHMHVQLLGGGFGRRLEIDFIVQAAEIAKALPNTPVQVIWSREDDVQHDFYRPATASVMHGGLNTAGEVTALRATSANQSIVRAYGARNGVFLARFDINKSAVEGMFDQPYAFPALQVSHHDVELPVPVGYWRAVGHSHQAFFIESFIDELAHAAGTDPVAFRLGLLREHPRAHRVLTLAAERAGWSGAALVAGDGAPVARGVALHRSFGSIAAMVAEVSIDSDGDVRVHRVTCAVDCGVAIHPEGVAQQMQSAVVYGLSAALFGEITIVNGRVQQQNFDGYRALRMHEAPIVETHVVPSGEAPGGIGEVGLPPVAPAVANAIFALTGERLRSLPLRPTRMRQERA
jgi:isoquinoline 1-oxidoreductase beta subunit